jgi:hypothetical protein
MGQINEYQLEAGVKALSALVELASNMLGLPWRQ